MFECNFYTGVGSRKTPHRICFIITLLASILEQSDYVLRSGGAIGSDTAFENGVFSNSKKHIFLTKSDKFSGNYIPYSGEQILNSSRYLFFNNIHPLWSKLRQHEKDLHIRNVFQVLGVNLDSKSKFLICWTKDGASTFDECTRATGGTGTAIKIAHINNIPVFNLGKKTHLIRILNFVKNKSSQENVNKINEYFPEFI